MTELSRVLRERQQRNLIKYQVNNNIHTLNIYILYIQTLFRLRTGVIFPLFVLCFV